MPLASFSSFFKSILPKLPGSSDHGSIRNPYLQRYSQRNMVMDLHNKKFTLIHGYKYVQPRDVARLILKNQHMCQPQTQTLKGDYLGCVVQWGEIKQLTRRFSFAIRNNDTLEDPIVFLKWYRDQFRI